MSLQEPAMGLAFYSRKLDRLRRDPEVQPRGHFRDWQSGLTIENELADDLLYPCRSGLGVGRYNDVIVTKLEVVPNCGIEMVVVNFPRLRRKLSAVLHGPLHC